MVDADRLRIVFRVKGVSFVMPVTDLLAIRGKDEDKLSPPVKASGVLQLGSLLYRETEVKVYDLAALFCLPEGGTCENEQLLIFAGSDYPWAIRADHVVGVVAAKEFEFQVLPTYLFCDEPVLPYQVAMHDGQLSVSVGAQQLDQVWQRSM